jgi:hypothetical protein
MNSLSAFFKKPLLVGIVMLIIGFSLGLLWGWVIQPVEWVDAAPDVLRPDYQETYLRMAIDSFIVNHDPNLAIRRYQDLGKDAPTRLAEIQTSPGAQDKRSIEIFSDLVQTAVPQTGEESSAPSSGGTAKSPWMKYLLIGVAVFLILAVGIFAYRLFRPNFSSGEATPVMKAQEINRQAEKTNYEAMGLKTPIARTMTTYVLGDNLYDESFSIETQAGEFMGEYGVGVSEAIGVGDPKKVTAMEVWLFDKNDIKTATKVLMSEHAYNDPEIRQKLEAKGELILVEPKKQIVLETQTLQLLATVADMEYGEGMLPPSSFFERLTLELAVWKREDA